MKAVLVMTPDNALRAPLLRTFIDSSTTFSAPSDAEALKTLRLIDVNAIFRDSPGPIRSAGSASSFHYIYDT